MMERECLGACEGCNRKIYEGDMFHYTADGCWLCEDHSPMLSDVLRQYLEKQEEGNLLGFEGYYESMDELGEAIAAIQAEIASNGDRKAVGT